MAANVRFAGYLFGPPTLSSYAGTLANRNPPLGGLHPASGSGTYDYVPYGGGSPNDPDLGDWRDLRLTLTLRPAGPMFFAMPQVGMLTLPDVGSTGPPFLIQWELPSHPEAGGGVLAGSVAGLEELPPDIPLFTGSAYSPYRLFWRLTYERYTRDCEDGPDPDTGQLRCKTRNSLPEKDGHWEYEWDGRSDGGEITPRWCRVTRLIYLLT